MTDDNNPSIPNSTVGTDTNGGHELDVNTLMNGLKLEIVALKATVQVLQTEFAEKEKQYEKGIAELKKKLTEQNDVSEAKQKLGTIIQTSQQESGEMAEPEQSLSPIHQMKVQLPLENWHDLLTLVPRNQLGVVVSEIGDRQFAYIIQSFLHDPVRKITLGEMSIIQPRKGVSTDRKMVKVWPNEATNMPNWPMPANVKNFMGIHLNYLDMSALNFLQKFQENSLLSNVNLGFGLPPNGKDEIMHDLTQIVPLVNINSIDSINCPVFDLLEMAYGNNNDRRMNARLLLKKIMETARIQAIELDDWECQWRDKIDWCFSWLYTPRDDGRPRMLISDYHIIYNESIPFVIERFKENFEMANRSVSFFVRIQDNDNVQPDYISCDNVKTNEKLVIKTKMDGNWKKLMISRYPLNAAKDWIEENEKEISEWHTSKLNRKIYVAWSDELSR